MSESHPASSSLPQDQREFFIASLKIYLVWNIWDTHYQVSLRLIYTSYLTGTHFCSSDEHVSQAMPSQKCQLQLTVLV